MSGGTSVGAGTLLLLDLAEVVTGASAGAAEGVLRGTGGTGIAIEGGRVVELAPEEELRRRYPDAEVVAGEGGVATPGFVDSHTHAVFGRWRADLRTRGEEELVELTRPRLRDMLRNGTTTVEIKSGYGLTTGDELKMLRVVRRLAAEGPLDLVPTFLGAHEVPPEYRGSQRGRYVELLVREMIPAVAEAGLARFCDVFMEPGVFSAAETRRILEAGLAHGLQPKLHADELEPSGGAELAAELGAASADHLGAVSDAGIRALARSRTVATLLPATLFFLGKKQYAPARRLLDAGATIALATDFNPGSAPSPSMPLALTIACSQMGLDPLEAIVAATAGGARALRLEDGRGTLAPGAPADVVLWGVPDHREIPYRFGVELACRVWKRGERVA
jgi:imidazolonepropionase